MKIGGKQQKDNSQFLPCPEGDHPAVLVDIIDLGSVETNYDGKKKMVEMVRFVFEAHPEDDDKTYLVFQRYTKSLHEKSTLRKHLKGWRGCDLSAKEEAEGYDIDVLLEKPCLLTVEHSTTGDNTYANISLIRALKKKTCEPAGTYQRPAKYGTHPHVAAASTAAKVAKNLPNTPENNPAGIDDGPAF